jgi:glycerophosphoryl diester phosphodiesterase
MGTPVRSKWLIGLIGVLVGLNLIYLAFVLLAQPAGEHPFFAQFKHHPLLMAHRGGGGLWPENTMYAFERAEAMHVDVLEMDVHSTADGVLVVIHDSTVDRTTDGTGAVQDLTLAEIKALDAAYSWSSDDGKTYPYRGQGIAVPALKEVFAAFPAQPMNVEIKQAEPSIAAPLCQMIRELGMAHRVLVASFHDQVMEEFRQECPEVATSASENEVVVLFVVSNTFLGAAYSPTAQSVQVPEYRSQLHVLTPSLVDTSHSRNLKIHAWTINEVEDMRRMLDLGVDGIITDYPDRLLQLLGF